MHHSGIIAPKLKAMALDPAAPSVIELTKEPMTAVPQKYIRPDQEPPAFSDGNPLPNVPTIDMKKLVLGEAIDLELEKLHSTCKEWGLFQVLVLIIFSNGIFSLRKLDLMKWNKEEKVNMHISIIYELLAMKYILICNKKASRFVQTCFDQYTMHVFFFFLNQLKI